MRSTALAAGLLASGLAHAQIVFQEDFQSGHNPFAFDGYNDYFDGAAKAFSGQAVGVGGERGTVWKTVFHDYRNDTYFGHRVLQKSDWPIRDTIHWAAYVKFGDEPRSPEWRTSDGHTRLGKRSYELKLPDIYPRGPDSRDGRIIGKFRSERRGGMTGIFILYTPNGQNHSTIDVGGRPFESGRWYSVEFAVEDRGDQDRVRIWIDNDDEQHPDYEHVGGDMFDSSHWRKGLRFDHGYRNHNVPRDTVLYYDDITIADSFIGLPPPRDPSLPRAPRWRRPE